MSQSPARRRYLLRVAVASAIYVLTVFLAIHVLAHQHMSMPFAIALAVFPSLPIVAIIAIVGLYLKEEKDEFQRELFIQSLLWGTGATLAVTSFWSFLHLFARVPPVDGFHVFILFWLFVGLSGYPLHRYYGGGSGE